MSRKNSDFIENIYQITKEVRTMLEKKHGSGTDLCGFCIEASEMIVNCINEKLGIYAKTVEGWCRYDDECYGSDHPWDPHTWVEVPVLDLYIDVTADQFNFGMYEENEFSQIVIRKGLPHGMCYDEPHFKDEELRQSSLSFDELMECAKERCEGTKKVKKEEKGIQR